MKRGGEKDERKEREERVGRRGSRGRDEKGQHSDMESER